MYPINRHFKLIALTEEDPTRRKLPSKEIELFSRATELVGSWQLIAVEDKTTVVAGSVAFFDLRKEKREEKQLATEEFVEWLVPRLSGHVVTIPRSGAGKTGYN